MFSPRRFVMIALVAGVTYYAVTHYGADVLVKQNPAVQKQADNVLGVASGVLSKGASASASIVSNLVLRRASEPLVKEFQKLKPEQQQEIKKQICK